MLKTMLILTLTCLLTCCNPYVRRSVVTEGNIEKEYSFLYGNFCGPGWPPPEKNMSNVEPIDDLDALCYAHDLCYGRTYSNSGTCDMVFSDIITNDIYKNASNSCVVLATDMVSAFTAKPYKTGSDIIHTTIARTTSATIGVVSGIVVWILNQPLLLLDGYPEEGTCNLGARKNPRYIVGKFQREYEKRRVRYGDVPMKAPHLQKSQ